jgi:hypothetical protein
MGLLLRSTSGTTTNQRSVSSTARGQGPRVGTASSVGFATRVSGPSLPHSHTWLELAADVASIEPAPAPLSSPPPVTAAASLCTRSNLLG